MSRLLALGETTVQTIDFSEPLRTAINGIQNDFVMYAGITIGAGFASWAAPRAIQMAKKFFSALIR